MAQQHKPPKPWLSATEAEIMGCFPAWDCSLVTIPRLAVETSDSNASGHWLSLCFSAHPPQCQWNFRGVGSKVLSHLAANAHIPVNQVWIQCENESNKLLCLPLVFTCRSWSQGNCSTPTCVSCVGGMYRRRRWPADRRSAPETWSGSGSSSSWAGGSAEKAKGARGRTE